MKSGMKWFLAGAVIGGIGVYFALGASQGMFHPGSADAQQPPSSSQYAELKAVCDRIASLQAKDSSRWDKAFAEMDSTSSSGSLESALTSDLQTVRSQLELYKVQHIDKPPSAERYVEQLLGRTNQAGDLMPASSRDTGKYPYGPYLQRMPANPFVEGEAASKIKFERGLSPYDGTTGWYVDLNTNNFYPNDTKHKGADL